MIVKKGEKWEVDSRMTHAKIEVLKDIDTDKDDFFNAKIVVGRRYYLTMGRPSAGPGDIISLRTTLTTWIKRG